MSFTLQFAGTGSAFTVGQNNYHSNMVLHAPNGEHFLIDCGTDARISLNEIGLSYHDIDNVFISHLHADHSGGLEWLGFTRYFDPSCSKPNLYICADMVEDIWNKSLAAGMSSLEGKQANLQDYFNVITLEDNSFSWQSCTLTPIKTIHVISNNKINPCYGLMIATPNSKTYITADTQFKPEILMPYYQEADLIFHDCNITKTKSPVHANYNELKSLAESIKNKMWLYHYNSNNLPPAEDDGFCGFVEKGQIFNI